MIDLVNNLLPSIEHFRIEGYWIALIVALLETTIGVGMLLPGTAVILILGALAARGYLDIVDLIWFAVIGALIGDNLNYYLGRKYGARWIKGGLWFLKPSHIDKAKIFMDDHGAKSVFLGRFIPSVKEVVPFIAGSVQMNRKTFMFWNLLGAIGWGSLWVLAGYAFAQSINIVELWLSRAGLFIGLLAFLVLLFYLARWLIIHKGKQFSEITVSIWHSLKEAWINNEYVSKWIINHPRSLAFMHARLNPTTFTGLPLSILTLGFVYVLALFGGIVEDVVTSDPIVAVDVHIASLFNALRTETLTQVFTWITVLGKSQLILGLIALSIALLWLWRKSYYILPLLISVTGSSVFTFLGKLAFQRPRPELAVYAEQTYSFPSGHATIAVAFFGFIGYVLMHSAQSRTAKVNIFFAIVAVILAIGFSRVYLGVHYISDIWSGYLVGAMWLIIAITFSEWLQFKQQRYPSNPPVIGARPISATLISFMALFYVGFSLNYHPPKAVVPQTSAVVVSKPIEIFGSESKKYTETLVGERQEPINFIFAARDEQTLTQALQQAGWVKSDQANLNTFSQAIKALILQTPYPAAPISPTFWNSKIQDLSFSKVPGTNWLRNAQHLKIWKTHSVLKNGKRLYVAVANANDGFKWGFMPVISADLDRQRNLLAQKLKLSNEVEQEDELQLVKPLVGKNLMGDAFFTDGKAYLISVK